MTTGELYDKYLSTCSQLGVENLTSRRVGGLLNELDMLGVIKSDLVNMGRHGRTRRIFLLTPPSEVEEAISGDDLLSSLLTYKPSVTRR